DGKWWLLPARYGPLRFGLLTASCGIGVFALAYGILAAHDHIVERGIFSLLFMAGAAWNQAAAQRGAASPMQRFVRVRAWGSRLGFIGLALFDIGLLLELATTLWRIA